MIEMDATNFNLKKKIVLEKWGEILKREMIDRCPKEYGTMVASIEAEQKENEVEVGTHGIDYATFVEYGTGSMAKAHGAHFPENPVLDWEALRERNEVGEGQTMPFASSANFFTEDERIGVLKEAFK